MQLKDCLNAVGTTSFERALLQELNQLLKEAPGEFPIARLCSPGWVLKENGSSTIMSVEVGSKEKEVLDGSIQIHFHEFLQRDCQDVMIEDKRAGTLQFALNLVTGQISFRAEQYPVRDYDPEEF